jgi:hypothetical protein
MTGSEDIRQRLLGSWRLVTWEERTTGGEVDYPLGPDAVGQLTYSPTGQVSAQLVRPDQPRFADDDWRKATPDERADAWAEYFGYFGSYSIDEAAGAVVHHVEGTWFPNLVGTSQVRYYDLDGDTLTLDADTAWGRVRIVWERVRQHPA